MLEPAPRDTPLLLRFPKEVLVARRIDVCWVDHRTGAAIPVEEATGWADLPLALLTSEAQKRKG